MANNETVIKPDDSIKIEIAVYKLLSGRYCARIYTPNGPTLADGASVEGVCRAVVVALVDALEESFDIGSIEDAFHD